MSARPGTRCEFVQVCFLMQDPHELAAVVVNAEADRSFQWRRHEADANSPGR